MKNLSRLFTRNSGAALIEFSVVLPFLLFMLLGMTEIARFAIITQKLDKTTNAMADYVTQGTVVCRADLNVYAQAASDIMSPFPFTGTIVFTSVVSNLDVPPFCQSTQASCISWQYTPIGATGRSLIGLSGTSADLSPYTLPTHQNVIVAEIFYDYSPMFNYTGVLLPNLAAQTLYRKAVYKPRLGTLTTICN